MIFPSGDEILAAADRLAPALGGDTEEITWTWEPGGARAEAATAPPPDLPEGAGTMRILSDDMYRSLCFLPPDYDPEDRERRWPILFFFHGIGERGSDPRDLLPFALPWYLSQGKRVDAVVLAPQCPENSHWVGKERENLLRWVPRMAEEWRGDPRRIYLTGLSMGGRCCWQLLRDMPGTFAAAAIVCGRTEVWDFRAIRDVPVWMFHGVQDDVIPFARVPEILPSLLDSGRSFTRLTAYPHLAHDVWTAAYARADLYTWLFAQTRDAPQR